MNRRSLLSWIAASPIAAAIPVLANPAKKEIDFSDIQQETSDYSKWAGQSVRQIISSSDGALQIDLTSGTIRISPQYPWSDNPRLP